MKKSMVLLAGTLMLSFNMAHAQEKTDCAVRYTRTACPGKEAVSYQKCGGEKSCTQSKPASTPEACQEIALQACANDRLDITKSKEITATYKGQPLKSKSGKDDFCLDYAKKEAEFNRCPG